MNFLKRLLQSFTSSNKEQATPTPQRKLFFHEDSYGQIEVLPRENYSKIEEENKRISDFATAHTDGIGYTDIYIRNDQEHTTANRKIKLVAFESILVGNGFEKHTTVYTGYSSYEEVCVNTYGYILDGMVVYCNFKNDIVQNIWMDDFNYKNSSDKKEALINCLYTLGITWNVILNDWNQMAIIDLQNKDEIRVYLQEEEEEETV